MRFLTAMHKNSAGRRAAFILMIFANLFPILCTLFLYRGGVWYDVFLLPILLGALLPGCFFASATWKHALVLTVEWMLSGACSFVLSGVLYVSLISGDEMSYLIYDLVLLLALPIVLEGSIIPLAVKIILDALYRRFAKSRECPQTTQEKAM